MLTARLISTVILLLTIGLVWSCSEDTSCTLNCNGELRFPMAVGYTWQYEQTNRITNFRPDNDSIGNVLSDSIDTYILTITITEIDTLLDGTVTYKWDEVLSIGDSLVYHTEQYYGNKEDGLYHYSSLSSPGTNLFMFKPFQQLKSASPQIVGLKSLEYPLYEGRRWEYTNGLSEVSWGVVYKEVVKITEQTVPAGKFECYEIQWSWPQLPKITTVEFLSDIGIVFSQKTSRDVAHEDSYSHAGGINGLADYITEFRLLSYPEQL